MLGMVFKFAGRRSTHIIRLLCGSGVHRKDVGHCLCTWLYSRYLDFQAIAIRQALWRTVTTDADMEHNWLPFFVETHHQFILIQQTLSNFTANTVKCSSPLAYPDCLGLDTNHWSKQLQPRCQGWFHSGNTPAILCKKKLVWASFQNRGLHVWRKPSAL